MEFKFHDFSKCIDFINLHNLMGIKADKEQTGFIEALQEGFKFEDPGCITSNKEKLLEINGQLCCLYMKSQYPDTPYRYHLFECSTILNMRKQGKNDRYVATSRHDGKFKVFEQLKNGHGYSEKYKKLKLCKNCYEILRQKGWDIGFNLQTFFEQHKNQIEGNYSEEGIIPYTLEYTQNWEKISSFLREQANYTCQECGVHFDIKNKYLLHVHHIDSNKKNNNHKNLKVLCIYCHYKKHPHMKKIFENEIAECQSIQNDQGIFEL